jgi:hypothetical protein
MLNLICIFYLKKNLKKFNIIKYVWFRRYTDKIILARQKKKIAIYKRKYNGFRL